MKTWSPYSFFFFLIVVLGCKDSSVKNTEHPVKFSNDFEQPVFSDKERVAKLQLAFPAVEKIYHDYAKQNHFPALVFGIVADNELIYSGATGMSNLKNKTAATTKSIFRIASMTKSFTAMAILKLRDEGKLSLTDPVSNYIAAMGDVTYPTQDSPPVTIQNLLTMTAGFPEDNPWGDRQLADPEEDLVKLIEGGISFSNAPGKQFEYSNLGYAMLGSIIGKVSGVPYQQYITENILLPLGMNNTYWEYTDVPVELLAWGYRWEDDQWKEEPLLHDGIYGAMGGLITSMEDFSKYVNLHLSAWPPRSGEDSGPVKRSSIREMHKPWEFRQLISNVKLPDGTLCAATAGYGYGLGWRKDCNGMERISHSGGLPGFGSEYRFYPEYGIGVISFANVTYAGAGYVNSLAMDTLLSISGIKPRVLPSSAILNQRKAELVQLLNAWDEKLGSEILAENFFMDLSREAWIKKSSEVFSSAGKITTVDSVVAHNQLRGTFVMHGEQKDVNVYFTLTPEQSPKIQELQIRISN